MDDKILENLGFIKGTMEGVQGEIGKARENIATLFNSEAEHDTELQKQLQRIEALEKVNDDASESQGDWKRGLVMPLLVAVIMAVATAIVGAYIWVQVQRQIENMRIDPTTHAFIESQPDAGDVAEDGR